MLLNLDGLLGLGKIAFTIVREIVDLNAGITAAKKIHETLLSSVLGAPMRFFEVTPLGRILNRFSKDVSNIDENLILSVSNFFQHLIRAITIIIVVSYGSPVFLITLLPISYIYFNVTNIYLNASRELKR